MLNHLYSVFCFLNIVLCVLGEGIYTVLAPGSLRPFLNYNVAVTVHEAKEPCEIEVGIFGSKFNITKTINVLPKSTNNVEFEIPKLEDDSYRLSVKGIAGIRFENSTHLNFREYNPLVYIQIDKPIYKPGDLVQFRIVFLNQKTHPEQLKRPMTIIIKNSDGNVVQLRRNVNLTSGVYTDNFQLSGINTRGWWDIEVHDGEKMLQRKLFGVIKYDLPTFETFLDVPEKVALTDEVIRMTVRSKYHFGQPVKGKATIIIKWPDSFKLPSGRGKLSKTFPINGTANVEFHIFKELPGIGNNLMANVSEGLPFLYEVNAYVEEDVSGKIQNASSSSFILHKHNVDIKRFNPTKQYHPFKLTTYSVVGQKFDGSPIQDDQNIVELRIKEFLFYSTFNKSGIATFQFALPDGISTSIYCNYLGTETHIGFIEPIVVTRPMKPDRFQLNIKTEKPKLKKDLFVEVKWTESINYFVYMVVGRGNIIILERVEVPSNTQSHLIKIKPTLEMIPEASIFVHYIYNDNLRFEEKTISFEEDFQNTLEISTTAKASPGDDVEIKISTDPNSYVGLLGIDQSILHYGNDHDLKKNEIFYGLRGYVTETPPIPGSGRYPGKISGLVSLTNAHFPWSTKSFYYVPPLSANSSPVPRVRFPETWIFDNFNVTNQAQYSLVRKIPDTITSWVITGFSMNSNTGFALTTNPTTIQVFKPFFISIDLPYSIKQGEIIAIPVLVFNYMNETVDAEVWMDNSDKEFDFVEATNEIDERSKDKIKEQKRIAILSNSLGSVSFLIKPKIVGILTLKVTALTALAGDSVHQKLKVESEGVTQYQNRAFFIHLSDKQEQNEEIDVDIPANVVPYSEHIEFSAVGDIIGLPIKYIENLVRLPDGFGEQNMINFVSSILALKYLQAVEQEMSNVTKTARNILKIGFQREQSFRHEDGSYSAYGSSDRSKVYFDSDKREEIIGSTWLTAYVARYFQQATEFIDIDQDVVTKSLEFLVTKQATSGNFAEFGHLFDFPHLNDVSLSAFVLLAFLENKDNSSKYENNIKKGLEFLVRSVDDADDIYSLSITAFVLQKVNHPLAAEVLAKLKSFAKNENGLTWWTANSQRKKRQIYAFKSSDIEVTSYALLAMLENEPMENVLPVVKWLTMQRNSHGGFTSTQDTVVGLQALIKFAEKTGLARTGSMDINFICEGVGVEDKGTINIVPENLMMLNIHELPKKTRKVIFTARGNISSLVQLSYRYNNFEKEPEQSLRLSVDVREDTPPKLLMLDICAEFAPTDIDSEGNKTNMIVIEIVLPSGYTTGSEILDRIRDFRTILFTETKKSDTVALIYLHSLVVGEKKCLSIEATKIHEVAKQKPVPVLIYDYYDKERRATEYYEVKSSLCDICKGDDCVVGCKNSEGTLKTAENSETFDL